jgi:hypothetical protein
VIMAFSSEPASATRCPGRAPACDCVKMGEPSVFVRLVAKAEYDQVILKHGMFLRASLVQVLADVDSLGRPLPDSLRGLGYWMAHDFRVERVWRKVGEPRPPATIRFVNRNDSMCPRPKWQAGRSYLVFAFRHRGRLETLLDCQDEHPSEFPETQRAFVLLDSLLLGR